MNEIAAIYRPSFDRLARRAETAGETDPDPMAKVPEQLHSRPPIQRMMVIQKLLSEGAYPNKTTIARAIEMSTKTVKRDLDFMRDRLLLPIEYDKKRRGFYYSKPVKDFPAIVVSEAELFALLVPSARSADFASSARCEKVLMAH